MEHSGEIYMITCVPTGKRYIGQTVSFTKKKDGSLTIKGTEGRWREHVTSRLNPKSGCRLLAEAIAEHGKNNFRVETLLVTNIKYLNKYEKAFINMYNSISPNGYNLSSGGGAGGRHHESSKEKISKANKGVPKSDEFKKILSETKKFVNLPQYIYLMNDKYAKGYEVRNHPTLPSKRFTSQKLSMEEKLQQAKDYLNSPEPPAIVKRKERPESLPKYIHEINNYTRNQYGYVIKNHPSIPRISFVRKDMSLEEKLEMAIECIKSFEMNEVHRPNGNGSQESEA